MLHRATRPFAFPKQCHEVGQCRPFMPVPRLQCRVVELIPVGERHVRRLRDAAERMREMSCDDHAERFDFRKVGPDAKGRPDFTTISGLCPVGNCAQPALRLFSKPSASQMTRVDVHPVDVLVLELDEDRCPGCRLQGDHINVRQCPSSLPEMDIVAIFQPGNDVVQHSPDGALHRLFPRSLVLVVLTGKMMPQRVQKVLNRIGENRRLAPDEVVVRASDHGRQRAAGPVQELGVLASDREHLEHRSDLLRRRVLVVVE